MEIKLRYDPCQWKKPVLFSFTHNFNLKKKLRNWTQNGASQGVHNQFCKSSKFISNQYKILSTTLQHYCWLNTPISNFCCQSSHYFFLTPPSWLSRIPPRPPQSKTGQKLYTLWVPHIFAQKSLENFMKDLWGTTGGTNSTLSFCPVMSYPKQSQTKSKSCVPFFQPKQKIPTLMVTWSSKW